MHVSPFLPMDVDYVLRYSAPGEHLVVRFDVMRGDERLLGATLSLRRRTLDRRALRRLLWTYPALTHRVSTGIYAQAARLRLRRAPFHGHPVRRVERSTPSPRGASSSGRKGVIDVSQSQPSPVNNAPGRAVSASGLLAPERAPAVLDQAEAGRPARAAGDRGPRLRRLDRDHRGRADTPTGCRGAPSQGHGSRPASLRSVAALRLGRPRVVLCRRVVGCRRPDHLGPDPVPSTRVPCAAGWTAWATPPAWCSTRRRA